jgi:hypothetical protein
MEKIQELLFENKESIPNGVYLELMNELKKSYITKDDNELIKITYTRIRPEFNKFNHANGYSKFNIDLITSNDMSLIIKKSDFIKKSHNETMKELDAIPFIPFWTNLNSCFNDYGYNYDEKYIFKNILKEEPEDSDDDEWHEEVDTEENKRKIKFKLHLTYDIKYLITNVEKI